MIPLQVHITAGPQAGTRLQVSQTPVTFGRSPENTLVLDLSTVSRNHGELRFEDDQWWLHNHSQNGTRVGRKRVTKKPRVLGDGTSIQIGDEEVFRLYFANDAEPAAAAAGEASGGNSGGTSGGDAQPTDAAPGAGLKGRSKLWLILGIWFVLCIGLFVLLATTIGSGDDDDGGSRTTLQRYTTAEDVRQILKREVERVTPSEHVYSQSVARAREAYNSRPRERYYYEAYSNFREALRNLPASEGLGPEDNQRYEKILDDLSRLIWERYEYAFTLYNEGQHERARDKVDELLEYYPASSTENEVAASILLLRERASSAAARR